MEGDFGKARCGALVLVILGSAYFFPLILGKHAVPFHFLPSWQSGLASADRLTPFETRLLVRRFPGNDETPITLHYTNALFAARCLSSGELPLWNPHVGCGTPALGCGQIHPLSPFQWPFFIRSTPWVYTLGLLFGMLWSGLGAWFWLRRFGWDPRMTTLAAGLWAFNPWTVREFIYPQVWAAWWFGWLLWSWDKSIEKPSARFWWPAAMIAGMVFCGHPETCVLLVGCSFAYVLLEWFFRGPEGRKTFPFRRFAVLVCLTASLAVFLTAIHWMPVVAHLREAFSYKEAGWTPAGTKYGRLDFLDPRLELYVSPLLLCLIVLGIWKARCNRELRPSLAILVFAFVMVSDVPLACALLTRLPLLSQIPLRYYSAPFWFGLVPFVGAGLNAVFGCQESLEKRERGGAGILIPLCLALWAVLYLLAGFSFPLGGTGLLVLCLNGIMALIVAVSVFWRPAWTKPALVWVVGGFLLLEPLIAERFVYPYFNRLDPAKEAKLPGLAAVMEKCAAGHGRFHAAFPEPMALTANLAVIWRARDVRLNEALALKRFMLLNLAFFSEKERYVGTMLPLPALTPAFARAMGVFAYVTLGDSKSDPLIVRELDGATERAFMVRKVVRAANLEESRARLLEKLESREWLQTVIIECSGPLNPPWDELLKPDGGSDAVGTADTRVTWIQDDATALALRCSSPSPSVLVLTDTFASGWTATLDGKAVTIFPADLAFRAVLLPAGEHIVKMRYRPLSVPLGLGLSAAGVCILACLMVRAARAKGRKEN